MKRPLPQPPPLHKNVSILVPQAIKLGLYDEFTLWDTNGVSYSKDGKQIGKPKKIASAVGKKLKIHDKVAWQKFLDKGKE